MNAPKRPIHKIACVGEVMIELIAKQDDTAQIGVAGDTFNTAHYLRQLIGSEDKTVSYVTALGDDSFSDRIHDRILGSGLDTTCIERRAGMMPGLYAIETDEMGERSFSYWRSTSAARTLFQEPCTISLSSLDAFDLVLITGISLAVLPPAVRQQFMEWAATFTKSGGTLAYDSNYRPRLWESEQIARDTCAAMWRLTDIALPSVDDEMDLFGDTTETEVLHRLKSYGVTDGALKRGANGPMDLRSETTEETLKPVASVVDSTAAGDSFNAGYLAAIAEGQSTSKALEWGHTLAAHVVTKPGAIVPLPEGNWH